MRRCFYTRKKIRGDGMVGVAAASLLLLAGLLSCICGCGGDAGMELAASDALVAVADQMQVTVQEYHQEVVRHDDSREDGMVAAFVARVRDDQDDAAAMEKNIGEFRTAMRKVRQDREVEWQRRSAAMSNVDVVREIAKGMQRLALDSLSLRDEMRRYIEGWINNQRRAQAGTKVVNSGQVSEGVTNGN